MTTRDRARDQNEPPGDRGPGGDAIEIAEVSHELRLPIANLRLLIETLLDGALEDPSASRRMLQRAHQEVTRLQNLVVNLLSMAGTASAGDTVQRSFVLLEGSAEYAVEATALAAKARGVTVKLLIEPGWRVYANAEQLSQVMLNLVENAVKFSAEGGVVTIRSGKTPGSFVVEDTGIGMAESEIPKIFQRFYRIDRSQSRGSTGLGLSIVKHILDLHGAKINVTSKEGVGSAFLLEFPEPDRRV